MKRATLITLLAAVLITALAACTSVPPSVAAPAAERDAVLAAMQAFFDAMTAKDADAMRRVLVEDGSFHAMIDADGKASMQTFPNAEFLRQLPTMPARMRERIREPEVRIHGPIATVWARYDFHIDGKPSHCGVDAFDLVRTADGWKIAGGVYTIERDGCEASPPGELKK